LDLGLEGINWLAVLVSSLVAFMIGGAWYGALFAKQRVVAYRFTAEEVEAMQKVQTRNFSGFFVAGIVIAAAMAILARNLGLSGWMDGLVLGTFVFVGFVAMFHLVQHLAGNYRPAAFFIDASYQLLWFLTTGAIVAAWK
jgi:hypothetical protein